MLEQAEQRLSEARISQASAATSLITPIDSAEAGIDPVGPSRAVILLVGVVGGLMVGIGIAVAHDTNENESGSNIMVEMMGNEDDGMQSL